MPTTDRDLSRVRALGPDRSADVGGEMGTVVSLRSRIGVTQNICPIAVERNRTDEEPRSPARDGGG
ncbi:hypothetical protein H483_0116945 [Dietzia sp. UCD-THP]|nr:hypothetical protein H483_0116945 [Dietzia sp. UCD-THP]